MDKKNTLLLTVIAVATLLVAIVGATFAYFTAQTGGGANVPINVTTSTADTTKFQSFGSLAINANQTNFGEETEGVAGHSLYAETTGLVTFTSSDAAKTATDYCYKVGLEVTNNSFDYSLVKTREESNNYPELVLRLYKQAGYTEGDASAQAGHLSEATFVEYGASTLNWASSLSTSDDTEFKTTSTANDSATVPYIENILQSTSEGSKICKDTALNTSEDSDCVENANISGYDITVLGNDSSKSEATYMTKKVLLIPAISEGNNKYEHKMTASTANSSVSDYWKVQVIFVNYSDKDITAPQEQELTDWKEKHGEENIHYADQNDNTNKKFNAVLKFMPLDKCSK